MQRTTGQYVTSTTTGERFQAFVPLPLPPEPPLAIDAPLLSLSEKANRALGRLDGISALLPDTELFLYQYIRKEAVLSSQIEGTQSSFSDLLLFEIEAAPGVPLDDVQEVSNYVAAMKHGLQRLDEGFPLSLRLLREIHEILLSHGRGMHKQPGEFRRSQNWIGGSRPGSARFVPPPPDRVVDCLAELETFIHEEASGLPVLIKAALIHVQFETIHPFLDGNGRLGRLLITLLLCQREVLRQPLLYLSLYFKTHRDSYYEQLDNVRRTGDWEAWLRFFLQGVFETATGAVDTANGLLALFEHDRQRIRDLGRIAGSCLQLHHLMQRRPIFRIPQASVELGINRTSISNCIKRLSEIGMVSEITGYQKHRLFRYDRYIDLLSEGTEPLAR
ncbi:MAG: Fic family protein [Chromatiaceae bacterium]|nr:Fic family protein [Chromatiaceae bacterium]MCP5306987.1 Fic family protein [Chromatiaceae bacterium]MCP5423385.1 Fic family protein [Chromatiaceae bacterium]